MILLLAPETPDRAELAAFLTERDQLYSAMDPYTADAVKVARVAAPGKGSAVKGTVFDPAQAAVPGALVRLAAKGSERRYTTDTSAEGAFEFASLPPGTYEAEVSAPGFQTSVVQQLAVGKDEAVRLELTLGLDPGAMEMGVIVMDDMTTNSLRNGNGVRVFGTREITSLPIR
jgi:hypothetical protein